MLPGSNDWVKGARESTPRSYMCRDQPGHGLSPATRYVRAVEPIPQVPPDGQGKRLVVEALPSCRLDVGQLERVIMQDRTCANSLVGADAHSIPPS